MTSKNCTGYPQLLKDLFCVHTSSFLMKVSIQHVYHDFLFWCCFCKKKLREKALYLYRIIKRIEAVDVTLNIHSPEQPVGRRPPPVFVPLAVWVPGDERGLGQVHGHRGLQCLPSLIGWQPQGRTLIGRHWRRRILGHAHLPRLPLGTGPRPAGHHSRFSLETKQRKTQTRSGPVNILDCVKLRLKKHG